ncbi:hypothetical protein DFH08DRAFT_149193 [Mycena albidolilacea]|uniref:Uncharacterized protein n=1 Tax=Mycena albidolilacea TaxID=1033008 RepID=A0AAD7A3P5_9AGAR|nr:hypothetical protein DFH08DRAFT_149193 [Mycena albidolilacea]
MNHCSWESVTRRVTVTLCAFVSLRRSVHPAVEIHNVDWTVSLNQSRKRVALWQWPYCDLQVEILVEEAHTSRKLLFLPVFHISLVPGQIPTPKDLEFLQAATETCIARASLSLRALFRPFMQNGAQEEMGPTVWPVSGRGSISCMDIRNVCLLYSVCRSPSCTPGF